MKSSDLCARLWKKRFGFNGTSSASIKSLHLESYLNGEATQYNGKHTGFRVKWPAFGSWLIHLASPNFYKGSTTITIIIILGNKIC